MKALNLGVASLLLASVFMPAANAQQELRASILQTKDSNQGAQISVFGEELEKLTDGRYTLKVFYSGVLNSEREAIESVQMGTLDFTLGSGAISNFVPAVKIFDIPFLFRDYPHARRVLDGEVGQAILKQYEKSGIKGLSFGELGFRHMTNNKKPIVVPSDLRGMKLRTMENPTHIAAYKGLEMLPTPMAFGEVFIALQQNVVDGQENPLSTIHSVKFHEVQKYLSLTGHVYSPSALIMNLDAYDDLSDADKEAFHTAAQASAKASRDYNDNFEAKVLTELRERGMKVNEDVDKQAFVRALAPVYAKFDKQFGKENIERIRGVQ